MDSLKIELLNNTNLSNTKRVVSTIILNIISSYIFALLLSNPSPQNIDNSTTQIIHNTTNNFYFGSPVSIKEIKTGDKYISSINKELKNLKDLRSKTIINIPIGNDFRVIKKYNKWLYISFVNDGNQYNGFIKIDNLYSIQK